MRNIIILFLLFLAGCSSTKLDSGGNPINRSLLIDHNFSLGIDIPIIPVPLPKFDIGFKLHFRRLSPQEEIDLELAKKGRYKGDIKPDIPLTGPTPPKFKSE